MLLILLRKFCITCTLVFLGDHTWLSNSLINVLAKLSCFSFGSASPAHLNAFHRLCHNHHNYDAIREMRKKRQCILFHRIDNNGPDHAHDRSYTLIFSFVYRTDSLCANRRHTGIHQQKLSTIFLAYLVAYHVIHKVPVLLVNKVEGESCDLETS